MIKLNLNIENKYNKIILLQNYINVTNFTYIINFTENFYKNKIKYFLLNIY